MINKFDISDGDSNGCFFDFPVATSILEPIEIVFILNLVTLNELDDFIEFITLINLDCHKCLNLCTDQFGFDAFIETHCSKGSHNCIIFLLFLVKIRLLVDFLSF